MRENETSDLTRRLMLLGGLATGLSACGKPQNIIGVPTTRPVTPDEVASRGHRIMVVTSRRLSEVEGEFYSGQRDSALNYGSALVVIPPSHKPGKVERPSSLPPDPDKHFVVLDPQRYPDETSFRMAARREVLKRPVGKRDAMMWVHGYNTTLTDALLRLAQFVEDSGYAGVPILYTWASQAKLTGYVYDINSALIARDFLERVPGLLVDSPVEGLDVVAHSMGNFLTMEAIRGSSSRGGLNKSGKLRNVILASPDIDIDLFISQLRNIPREDRNFFVLTSSDDRALATSRLIARRPRLGQLPADSLSKLGVNVIDLSQVQDTSSIHHNKFADAPEIVQLLGDRVLAGDSFSGPRTGVESLVVGAGGELAVVGDP